MPAFLAPLAISGLSALAGLFNKGQQQQQQQQSQTTSSGETTGASNYTNAPFFDEQSQALRDQLIRLYSGRAGEDPSRLADSIISGQLNNLNRGSELVDRTSQSILASRGLNFSNISPAIRAITNQNRAFKGVDILNSRDQLMEQIMSQRMGEAAKFFQTIPYGTSGYSSTASHNEGVQNTIGTGTVQGNPNPLGQGVFNLADMIASLYGQGAFSPGFNPNNRPQYGNGGRVS